MKIRIDNVRLAFPSLFTPRASEGSDVARYSAILIFPPDHPANKVLKEAMAAVAKEKYGEKWSTVLKSLIDKNRVCYRTDPKINKDGEVYDGFEGMHYVSASNRIQPRIVDGARNPLTEADGKPYGGCYVNAVLDVYALDHKDPTIGRRISACLLGVQFAADGDAFGAVRVASADDFEALSTEDAIFQ